MSAALAIDVNAALQGASHQVSEQFARVARQRSSSCPQQHRTDDVEDSWGSKPRTIRDCSAEQNDVLAMKAKFKLALVSDYGDCKSAHKTIAKHAGCSPRTVEAWMEERSLPGFEYVWRLGKKSQAVQMLFLEMISHDMDLDPKAYSAFLELQRMMQK